MKTFYNCCISGTGSYLPETILTNADLEKRVQTTDAWIQERTGIQRRHICHPEQATSDLAFHAATQALQMANLTGRDLDAIIVATVTPDQPLPSTACFLQDRLGCRAIMAFDVVAACSGFLYALSLGNQMIQTGQSNHVLVIGSEALSRITNYEDRQSCILFGDGAGAVIVSRGQSLSGLEDGVINGADRERTHGNKLPDRYSEILASHSSSEGRETGILQITGGGSRSPMTAEILARREHLIQMQGKEVYKIAVRTLAQSSQVVLEAAQLKVAEVDWFLFHQANLRIIESVASQLDVPLEKVLVNIQETGNTSSASIPILLDENVRNGKIKRGQNLLLSAFGAGLTSSALALRF